ncbi:MAG: hypothetical protein QOE11_1487 [Solirubrobacteraceae bacterium]|nr:hypothetical protein [Solirubrobacteraceae bacterium]
MILSTILLAAAEAEKSKLPFFVAGALLASYAIVVSVIGFKKPDFPADQATARGVMGIGITLVAMTMISIVYVSN